LVEAGERLSQLRFTIPIKLIDDLLSQIEFYSPHAEQFNQLLQLVQIVFGVGEEVQEDICVDEQVDCLPLRVGHVARTPSDFIVSAN
jgi:hypothetical protein